jgi:hypothetical protein
VRFKFLLCAAWLALSVFAVFGDEQPQVEEVKPLALADVQPLAGDWELSVDPKKSILKAMRATIEIKEIKTPGKPSIVRGNIVYHFTTETSAATEEVENAPQNGIDFEAIVKGKKRYLKILPEVPVKPAEKLLVEFALEKDTWIINASMSKQYFFPGGIPTIELSWEKLVWKRIPKKGK